jgi:hypothetical protein
MELQDETLVDRFIEIFGREKFIESLIRTMPERVLAVFSKEEILSALIAHKPEEIFTFLLDELGPDQLRRMIDEFSSNQSASH